MANIKSAIKRAKTNEKARLRNKAVKTNLKTTIKKFDAAVAENSADTDVLYKNAVSAIDKAALKGTIHKNKANRTKAQLAKKLDGKAE